MSGMNIVYLLIGSNLEDRSALLQKARNEIASHLGQITLESSIYESEPWGFYSEDRFLNQVVRIETELNPQQLLDEILKIEIQMGRKRDKQEHYGSRTIDIDILFFNNEIIAENNLIIPHPKIQERMFTLLPLSEMDRTMIHPGSLKSIGELIAECRDKLNVYPYHH
jgi:2-amino-4-hydroxy-6-hydroxymethyldihydropteridine diphosphokinase